MPTLPTPNDYFRTLTETNMDKDFFTVRGYMKSGTNWICNLLNLHPDIHCIGEFHWERVLNGLEQNRDKNPRFSNPDFQAFVSERIDEFIRACMLKAAEQSDARWIGDRTPWSLQPVLLREVRQIYIMRDIRDVLVSRAYHLLNRPEVTGNFRQDAVMKKLSQSYQSDHEHFLKHPHELLSSEAFVAFTCNQWSSFVVPDIAFAESQESGDKVLVLRYEEVHRNTGHERERMYAHLGLTSDKAEPISGKTTAGFSVERPSAFYRKGQVGDWQKYFTPEVTHQVKELVGETMMKLGYVNSQDW